MEKYLLPWSKSWAIRMLFLDMLHGKKSDYRVIGHFLGQNRYSLPDDVITGLDCAMSFIRKERIFDVGNAGTVARFILYIMHGRKFELRMGEQLKRRIKPVPDDLTKLSIAELLRLGTSQYASAALLMGAEPIEDLPPKCLLTLEAKEVYFKNKGQWAPRYDEVIIGQLEHFLHGTEIKDPIAEDYCHLRAFGLITREEGQRRWPELANHECDRLKVMEDICTDFDRYIDAPDDHRVVMAVVLRQRSLGLTVQVSNKECVAKSWPQFWKWLAVNT